MPASTGAAFMTSTTEGDTECPPELGHVRRANFAGAARALGRRILRRLPSCRRSGRRMLVYLPLLTTCVTFVVLVRLWYHDVQAEARADATGTMSPADHRITSRHLGGQRDDVACSRVRGGDRFGAWTSRQGVMWAPRILDASSSWVAVSVRTSRCPQGRAVVWMRGTVRVQYTTTGDDARVATLRGDVALCLQRLVAEDAAVYPGVCRDADGAPSLWASAMALIAPLKD